MSKKIKIFFFVFCAFFFKNTYSQEKLIGLSSNSIIKSNLIIGKKKKKINKSNLEMPFFDDFSFSNIFPADSLWQDNMAFINKNYGINVISVGVATLDAIDNYGSLYDVASNYSTFKADTLTSQEINLDFEISDSIYLSFFYQPQGNGDEPETNDSLILEFFSPLDSIWNLVWSVPGEESHNFKNVMIPINDTIFLQKNFRFRFCNYVSLSGNNPGNYGRSSDVDHWNLDWIYLNKNRTKNDTIIDDTSVLGISNFLKNYTSMPWTHFKENDEELKDQVFYSVKNNSNRVVNIQQNIEVLGVLGSSNLQNYNAGADNINPYTIFSDITSLGINPFFPIKNDGDSAMFSIKFSAIEPEPEKITNNKLEQIYKNWNDTIYKFQKFFNYYSFDDGTAENGYGISGQGTHEAVVAYKFNNYKLDDSLRAVQFYFNQSLLGEIKYFYLTVWEQDEETLLPGKILYQKTLSENLEYSENINEFLTFKFHKENDDEIDTAFTVQDTFFVGWKQTTNDFLNVGYDVNKKIENKIFYNIGGEWLKSSFDGALMIRPVFGKSLRKKEIDKLLDDKIEKNFKIFPNPVRDKINLICDTEMENEKLYISIFDYKGQNVFYEKNFLEEIDISFLENGIYFLRISDLKTFEEYHKIIKLK